MRYTGPVHRKSRRLKFSILETNKEFLKGKKRTTVPGQHGLARQKKLSAYGNQLLEKQKIKNLYGITEKQLLLTYKKAKKIKGITGHNLLFLLESRLDNLVYRSNLAPTRKAARQLVTHGHVLVDNKKLDIPSAIISIGQTISLKDKVQKNKIILENLKAKSNTLKFIELDPKNTSSKFIRLPRRDELNSNINEQIVIEYFSR